MISKTKTKAKDKKQSKRFIDKAREIGADESAEAFERAFKEVVPPKKRQKAKSTGRGRGNSG